MTKIPNIAHRSLPWITGAGLAASHTLLSSNCSVPKSGHCSTCGSCIVALGTLVSWALWKQGKNQPPNSNVDGDYDECA